MKLNKISIICANVLFMNTLFAVPADIKNANQLVSQNVYNDLVSKGNVSVTTEDGSSKLQLVPESIYSEKIRNNLIQKKSGNFPFTYESIYLLSKKDLLKSSNSIAETISISDISKVCRSVSKMEGMKYYSSTRKKELTLYEKAYMLADSDSKTPIPDQNTGSADGQISYCLQDDNSFGECRYKLSYNESENELLAVFENLDILGIGPFKAVHPGKLTIKILAIDCGEDILLYFCTDLDSVKYPGIKGQITDSMVSRIDAIYNWFLKQF